ncbi:potassium-transporting ATPase subunit KdpC [Paenibacillus sp. KN14-4R]|uniref:potassium-transporting ATPase subunit KdpC n=1 Tax=Paenibacillus sp. KN14-4R TaxID=3445773 RepID=UPI003FA174D8
MKNSVDTAAQSGGSYIWTIVRMSVVLIVLCGIIYPLACTGIAQVAMPNQANGSLIKDAKGNVMGSELIGQKFTDSKYFSGRVSSIDYKAEASGSNNYGPSNPDLLKRTQASIEEWKAANPDVPVNLLPIDLITNSGSGLDPHITPASAKAQIPRISGLTGLTAKQLNDLVSRHTEARDLGVFGEERVNVLKLNIELSSMLK